MQQIDPDFAETSCGSESNHLPNWQAQRKAQQYCRQVQRALNLALEGRADRDGIFIEDVSPAPDCGRLLAYVVVSNGGSVSDAIQALCQAAPWLRSEVTRAISRKRAPELFFIPANPQQGEADE